MTAAGVPARIAERMRSLISLLGDAFTVLRKELYELVVVRSREPGRLLVTLVVMLLLGVLLPLYAGPFTLDQAWLLTLWAWAPVLLVASIVADSVAGERDNHTLETLMASRLPDRAILLGKVGAAVAYGWGLMLLTVVLSVVTVNLAWPGESLLLYRPLMAVGGGLLSLLASVLAASVGVLISLGADSLRQAQRRTWSALLAILALQMIALPLLVQLLHASWGITPATLLLAFESGTLVTVIAVVLAFVDVVLLSMATGSFQRRHLHMR